MMLIIYADFELWLTIYDAKSQSIDNVMIVPHYHVGYKLYFTIV